MLIAYWKKWNCYIMTCSMGNKREQRFSVGKKR